MVINFPLPEDKRTEFQKVEEELERATWVGRGPHYTLPGGGNDLKEPSEK